MKKSVLVIILFFIIGLVIGYFVKQKLGQQNAAISAIKINKTSLNDLIKKAALDPKSIGLYADILGNHKICKNDYVNYQKLFWKSAIIEKPTLIQTEILDAVAPCTLSSFVEFNTNNDQVIDLSAIKCQKNHNLKTSCYPITMFYYLAMLQNTNLFDFYVTKGIKKVDIQGVKTDVTITMFKLVEKNGLSETYYDIVDDPTNIYDPTGKPECEN